MFLKIQSFGLMPLYLAYSLDKLLQAFHGQICLNRNKYAVSADKGVYGNHAQRGHTVD
jgi:hypothetical protein